MHRVDMLEEEKKKLVEQIRKEAKNRIKYLIPENQNNYEMFVNIEMKKILKERNLEIDIDENKGLSVD